MKKLNLLSQEVLLLCFYLDKPIDPRFNSIFRDTCSMYFLSTQEGLVIRFVLSIHRYKKFRKLLFSQINRKLRYSASLLCTMFGHAESPGSSNNKKESYEIEDSDNIVPFVENYHSPSVLIYINLR